MAEFLYEGVSSYIAIILVIKSIIEKYKIDLETKIGSDYTSIYCL
jgi:hypothetical protein